MKRSTNVLENSFEADYRLLSKQQNQNQWQKFLLIQNQNLARILHVLKFLKKNQWYFRQ